MALWKGYEPTIFRVCTKEIIKSRIRKTLSVGPGTLLRVVCLQKWNMMLFSRIRWCLLNHGILPIGSGMLLQK